MTAPSQQAESGSTVSALVAQNLGPIKFPIATIGDEIHNKLISIAASIAAIRTSKHMRDRRSERTVDVSCHA